MSQDHGFITYLKAFAEDRGALAALRRGLGQPPGTVPDMFRYVVPVLPKDAFPGSWTERSYYLLAALYASHPDVDASHPTAAAEGNLGNHFAVHLDMKNPERNDAIERRFIALLTAHPDDLHIYLRQAISFLRSKETPVNWHQLMWDVLQLGYPDSATTVRKRWADAFWRHSTPAAEAANGVTEPEQAETDAPNTEGDDSEVY
jgi:CRISPR system Cascade subunit CasB